MFKSMGEKPAPPFSKLTGVCIIAENSNRDVNYSNPNCFSRCHSFDILPKYEYR